MKPQNLIKYQKLLIVNIKFIFDESDLIEFADDILLNYDEPFGDSSALPTYLLSKYTKNHVKVVLTGDGGDELFGG